MVTKFMTVDTFMEFLNQEFHKLIKDDDYYDGIYDKSITEIVIEDPSSNLRSVRRMIIRSSYIASNLLKLIVSQIFDNEVQIIGTKLYGLEDVVVAIAATLFIFHILIRRSLLEVDTRRHVSMKKLNTWISKKFNKKMMSVYIDRDDDTPIVRLCIHRECSNVLMFGIEVRTYPKGVDHTMNINRWLRLRHEHWGRGEILQWKI